MPLSNPVEREPRHHRRIRCDGYRRVDGLWDVEAHLVDTKPFDLPNRDRGGHIPAGDPLHEMWLRLTLDETMLIHAVEAATDHGPFALCPRVTPNFRRLEGERIGPGWRRRVRELLGGVEGCTHLVELLTPLATTAFQTIHGARYGAGHDDSGVEDRLMGRLVGSCHALAADSPVVRELWPRLHRGPTKD
jgi:hypothetical protein